MFIYRLFFFFFSINLELMLVYILLDSYIFFLISEIMVECLLMVGKKSVSRIKKKYIGLVIKQELPFL